MRLRFLKYDPDSGETVETSSEYVRPVQNRQKDAPEIRDIYEVFLEREYVDDGTLASLKTKWRSKPWKVPFIVFLSKYGNVSHACRCAGISRITAYRNREFDSEFAELWDHALDIAGDALEEAAYRRSTEGIETPVFKGGDIVGYTTQYSDYLLKYLIEENRKRKSASGQDNGPVVVKIIKKASMDDL